MTTQDFSFERIDPDSKAAPAEYSYKVWYGSMDVGVIFAPDPSDTRRWKIAGDRDEIEYESRPQAALALGENRCAGRKVKCRTRRGGGYARDMKEMDAAKPTTRIRTALNRLERHLAAETNRVEVESLGTGYYVLRVKKARENGGEWIEFRPQNVNETLANLVDLALARKRIGGFGMTRDEVRATIALTRLPSKGLSGWQERCLRGVLSIRDDA